MHYLRFAIVGIANTLVDFVVLNGLILLFTPVFGAVSFYSYIAFKICSFLISVTGSYFMNKYWVFKMDGRPHVKEEGTVFLVSGLALVISIGCSSFLFSLLEAQNIVTFIHGTYDANISALGSAFVSLVVNYLGYRFIVFRKKS